MKALTRIRRTLGVDTRRDKYSYGHDPEFGHMSASRVAEKWIKTTCGCCSVGCGMLVGVTNGKAVAVRGNPDHPVNSGKLCPKGLSEHHTLTAPGRATTPLLRRDGVLVPVSWGEALHVMLERISAVQVKYGNGKARLRSLQDNGSALGPAPVAALFRWQMRKVRFSHTSIMQWPTGDFVGNLLQNPA